LIYLLVFNANLSSFTAISWQYGYKLNSWLVFSANFRGFTAISWHYGYRAFPTNYLIRKVKDNLQRFQCSRVAKYCSVKMSKLVPGKISGIEII